MRNVSNPAAVGYESDDGRAQVVQIGDRVFFGLKGPDGKWSTTGVSNPERFGYDGSRKSVILVAKGILESEES